MKSMDVQGITFENLTINGKLAEPEIYHNLYVRDLIFIQNGQVTKHIDRFVTPDTIFSRWILDRCATVRASTIVAGDGQVGLIWDRNWICANLMGVCRTLGGVPFHIPDDPENGAIILRSSQHLVNQPYWSYPIRIDRPVKYLFFLHGTAFTDTHVIKLPPEPWIGGAGKLRFNQSKAGTPLWYYRVRYADNGFEIRIPVKAGWNVEDWEIWAPGGWVVLLNGKKFYIQQWDNPYPERPVAYVKVETALQPEVPIVLGMTMGITVGEDITKIIGEHLYLP